MSSDNTASYVTVGKGKVGGYMYRAPAGTTPPNDASTALASAYKCLGYISEEGVKNSNEIESVTIKDWNGDTVLQTKTGRVDKWTVTLIEAMNPEVLKAVWGDSNISGALATGLTINANNTDNGSSVYVFEMIYNGNVLHRVVLPNAYVAELGEITYAAGDAVGFNIGLIAAADTNGNTHYEYIKQPGT